MNDSKFKTDLQVNSKSTMQNSKPAPSNSKSTMQNSKPDFNLWSLDPF
jgi:hypothetical protein